MPQEFVRRVSHGPDEDLPHHELIARLGRTTGLPVGTLSRMVAEVLDYFSEPVDEFVRRRHAELRRRGFANADMWPILVEEVGAGRYRVTLTERQVRRIIYG